MPRVPSENKGGDCFEVAAKFMFDATMYGTKNLGLRLVHGEVTGQGAIDGVKFGHAWVEDGGTVIDKSNGKDLRLPKSLYYALGDISKTIEYTYEEMRQKLLESGHYGPWDLKTAL